MNMKLHPRNPSWLSPALASLALVCAAGLAQAQTANDYIVSQFDDGTVDGWAYNYGGVNTSLGLTLTNDPAMNHGDAGPGALGVYAPFDLCTLGGDNQTDFEKVFSAPLDLTKYTALHFSMYVDTNSARLSDWGAGSFGNITPHIRLSTWGGDVPLNNSYTASYSANYGTWQDFSVPIDQTTAGNQATLQACGILGFQIWSGWGTCAAPIGLTNAVTFWMDNIWFEWNTNTAPPPPPTMSLTKAGLPGVMIALGSSGGQYDRQAISTPAPNGSYIWTAQGGYPVSYSCTITDFPPVGTHLGYEAHIYIVNQDTAPAGNDTGGSPDWNCPDVFIFRIENTATAAMAQIQWKTNDPAANAANIPVVVYPPSALGTWTVTFTDATHGSLSGPGLTATNFTLPDDAVANNFSPSTSFVQFGNFKNDGANDGHNNDATGTFGHVTISGKNAAIDDDFSGATLTNKYAWRTTSSSEVQYIAPGTAWFLGWTLPANGFVPQVAGSITGPWTPLTLSTFQNGTNVQAAIPASDLPPGNAAFFDMIKRPFTRLQVLLPGETNAPGTTTGKIGTPLPQTAGTPFAITVNACSDNWYIVSSFDTVDITTDDPSGYPPPDAALASGTLTFSPPPGMTLETSGTWHITASDVANTNITSGVSSPITIP